MQAISIYTLVLSFAFNAGDIFKARGKLRVLIQISVFRAVILIPALWWAVTVPGTITAVGWTQTSVAAITSTVNLVVAARIFEVPLLKILTAFRPAFFGGALMGLALIGIQTLVQGWSPVWQLALLVPLGAAVYLGALWVFQRKALLRAVEILQSSLAKR